MERVTILKLLASSRWITGIATLLVAMLLCWQCVDIYLDGNAAENLDANGVHLQSVYRMEDVTARLRRCAVPLIGYAVLVAGTCILHLICTPPDKTHHALTAEHRLRLMKARIAELPADAAREEHARRLIRGGALVLILICAVISLVYLLNGNHFTSWDLEQVMGSMMLHVAPMVLLAFLVAIAASFLCHCSIERELTLLKGLPLGQKTPSAAPAKHPLPLIRVLLYAVAVVFIVLGVMNGGLRDVLVKAINICTECIGLG